MKKLLVLALAVISIVCVFVMSASAEEVLNEGNALITSTSDEFATGDNINYVSGLANEIYFNGTSSNGNKTLSLEQRMVLRNDDGTYSTFPSAYLFDISKDGSKRVHRFQWLDITLLNSVTGQSYDATDLIRLEIPEGIIDIHHDDRSSNARLGMQNSSDLKAENLKYISFPASCTGSLTMGDFARGITALEEVDFSKMTNPHNFSMSCAFYGCTSLSKVTFPETFASDGAKTGTCQLNEHMFRDCTALTSLKLPKEINYINKNAIRNTGIVTLDISNTIVTGVHNEGIAYNASLKAVKFPTTLTNLEAIAMRDNKVLEFVDFGDNQNTFTMPGWGVFFNCEALVAISLPAKTQSIPDRGFSNCKNLKALYMGEEITALCGNKGDGAGDGPAFAECHNMYFVQDAFSVTKEDGSFYSVEEFEMPAKPRVFYFPSTLVRICNTGNRNGNHTMDANGHVQNTGADDLAFSNCKNLNSILVFPEGFTGFDDISNTLNPDQRGDTMSTGFMHNCATKDNPVTLVFMGRIDRVSMDKRYGRTSYMTYVFANEANTGFDNTLIGSYIGDNNYSNQNEMYVVFCHAEGGAVKYQINFEASGTDKVPALKTTLVEGSFHLVEDKKTVVVAEPNCVTDRLINTFCFCGEAIDKNKAEEGTALGHEFDLEKGATRFSIVYANYLANGTLNVKCARCDECDGSDVAPIISNFKGYSTKIDGEGLTFGYTIDYEALDEFVKVNGKSVELGFVVAAKAPLGEDAPLTSEGNAATNKVVKASIVNWTLDEEANAALNKYTGADFKLSGNWEGVKDAELYMAGYLISDSSIVYLNVGGSSETADYTTYNKVLASESTSEEETPVE